MVCRRIGKAPFCLPNRTQKSAVPPEFVRKRTHFIRLTRGKRPCPSPHFQKRRFSRKWKRVGRGGSGVTSPVFGAALPAHSAALCARRGSGYFFPSLPFSPNIEKYSTVWRICQVLSAQIYKNPESQYSCDLFGERISLLL